MKKHIIFGGFDYAVYWEMNQDAIYQGIDYFVDNDPKLIGTTYIGKPIYSPEELLKENKDDIIILIGSIIYHLEIELQLKDMGFKENIHFQWAISFTGDDKCPRLWHYTEWNDRDKNFANLRYIEENPESLERLKIVARLIDFKKISTIVDLGAANGRIEEFLPKHINYVPVDYTKYSEKTVLCNLNEYEFPALSSSPETTCIVMIGAIQYVHDWRWLLTQISEHCFSFICTHNDFVRMNREYRRTHFNNNAVIFNHQIILEAQKLGFKLAEAYDFHLRCVIMRFERSKH